MLDDHLRSGGVFTAQLIFQIVLPKSQQEKHLSVVKIHLPVLKLWYLVRES